MQGIYDITAASFHAYPYLADTIHPAALRREFRRALRPHRGGALHSRDAKGLRGKRMAIPGK